MVSHPRRLHGTTPSSGFEGMTNIESIEALTADVFSDILRECWSRNDPKISVSNRDGGPKVKSISSEKVDQGVLSDVYRLCVSYDITDDSTPTTNWLAKFCRPDLDLSWMCRNETTFYSRVAPKLLANATKDLPFSIPSFLDGSDKHLIIEEVTNIQTYPLSEGCPPDKIEFLLKSLAAWHALCWESKVMLPHSPISNQNEEKAMNGEDLVFPTGMGQRLLPLQKEGLFVSSWKETIEYMRSQDDQRDVKLLDTELLDFLTPLCERLATLRLRDIHEKVHQNRVTCVHGDYHIANWLFPKDGAETSRKPVLVDFATTGYGNPMVDLVFFLVVSTNDETVSDYQAILERYYNFLIQSDPSLSSKISITTLKEWFPWAILCQFLILVAYDGVCRAIAGAEQDTKKRESQIQHFCNVNRRMALAIRSIGCWDTILSQLEPTTNEERQQAQLFCKNTVLAI